MYALAVAEQLGWERNVILYLKKAERPDRAALTRLVAMLDGPVEDLVRKDSRFAKLGLSADDYVGNPGAVIDVLVEHPMLLQRPVIVAGGRAIIGRPRERVGEFLGG